MSDSLDARAMGGNIRGSVGRPGPVHEAVWGALQDMVAEAVAEAMPQLADVVGDDGGAVRVQMDGEDGPREVGFARKHGQRYRAGDRVLVQRLRGGDQVVLGTFSDTQGQAQRAVGEEDMNDNAVTGRSIKAREINAGQTKHIAEGTVDKGMLVTGVQATLDSALQPANVRGGALGNNKLLSEGDVQNSSGLGNNNKLVTKNDLPDLSNYAKLNQLPDLSPYVKTSELATNAKGNKALATEEWVTKNFAKKSSGGGGSGG